jgi:methyl-accepting chemotaxis protein
MTVLPQLSFNDTQPARVQSNMTIGKKLLSAFGVMLAITVLMGMIALWNINNLGANLEEIGHQDARKLFLAGDVNNLTSDLLATSREVLLLAHTKDVAAIAAYQKHWQDDMDQTKKDLSEFLATTNDPEARQVAQGISDVTDKMATLNDQVYQLAVSGKLEEADQLWTNTAMPIINKASDDGDKLMKRANVVLTAKADSAVASITPVRWATAIMLLLSMLIGAGGMYIVVQINRTLRIAISELSDGSQQVASAASQVSSSSQSLAQGSSEQAASLEETSASMEEINAMARGNSEHADSAATVVREMKSTTERSSEVVKECVRSMEAISQSSDKISGIIGVIDKIAFQTNILALNAAVEAARAGEAGLGFAVVADEVRTLAQRCAQAAQDTSTLIQQSLQSSSSGKVMVQQVAESGRSITEQFAKIATMVEEISLGSQQQGSGIDQVSKAITQMEQVTQQTAANAEEGAAAAEELTAQSGTLNEIIFRLTSMVEGEHAQLSRSHVPHTAVRGGVSAMVKVNAPGAVYAKGTLKKSSAGHPRHLSDMKQSFEEF